MHLKISVVCESIWHLFHVLVSSYGDQKETIRV